VAVDGHRTDRPVDHAWNLTPAEAIALQSGLAGRVVRHDDFGAIRHVAGIDIGFEDAGRTTRAAVVVLAFPSLALADHALVRRPTDFPYIPGLLSFREIPAALAALEKIRVVPDLLLCDGQGIAHPRRCGLASHLGLASGLPSIGVAKSLYVGRHEPLPDDRGSHVPLIHRDEVVGAALRTRAGVQPVFVSIGHRVGIATALDLTMRCTTRYRQPETTRFAHRLASGSEAELLALAASTAKRRKA